MSLGFLIFGFSAIAATASTTSGEVTPLEKVIIMLEDLQTEVVMEGKAEAKTYDKFACFCKDQTAEKTEAIKTGSEEKDSLESHIEQLLSDRDELDAKIAEFEKAIAETEAQMKKLEAQRAETEKVFSDNSADMKGAIAALKGAIDVLKASRPSSFAEIKSIVKTVRKATLMADALGLESPMTKRAIAALLQQPEVPMQNYDFKSEGIITTLEELMVKFKSTLNELDAEETKSIAEHDSAMQELTTTKADQEGDLAKTQKRKGTIVEEIAATTAELSSVSATLLDDQEYLMELAKNCQAQGKMWDQRTKVRKEELTALTQAISVIKGTVSAKTTDKTVRFVQKHAFLGNPLVVAANDDAMEAIEAASEKDDAAPNFLQKSKAKVTVEPTPEFDADGKRAAIINLLRTESKALKSTLLASLVSQVEADPFAKVKKLIQELIERLLQEAADEANHKGWCDKETSAAKQTRDYKADEIEQLNGALATAEAKRDKLQEEVAQLEVELEGNCAKEEEAEEGEEKKEEETEAKEEDCIKGLYKTLKDATKEREEEKAENEQTIKEAEEGQVAVEKAIQILSEFYAKAAKEGTELVQDVPEMPDAGFDGAYKGKGAESGGILGMLDVILGDFKRTIAVTTKDEATAAQEFLEFERQTKMSIATKEKAKEHLETELTETKDKIASDNEDLNNSQELLDKALTELQELHSACVDTGMSYADRVAMREQEIDALKKALCILDTMGPVQTEGC
eukprot:gnl/MRDRNA2_/MRDRNA2_86222_c0_seq1.p1 gnl/MRDRNA2_/MRDRNA2_86222_c0~~gnl/MRDRNA2_/MRDRNA2_86222_c0_seq1.p1  ORF type:complete len:742 (-),score=255.60 gnl/MRDRNA2_/MRDRNA2_86222_c0_seq1:31-2256(-)